MLLGKVKIITILIIIIPSYYVNINKLLLKENIFIKICTCVKLHYKKKIEEKSIVNLLKFFKKSNFVCVVNDFNSLLTKTSREFYFEIDNLKNVKILKI